LSKALANANRAARAGDLAAAERWVRVAERTDACRKAKAEAETARRIALMAFEWGETLVHIIALAEKCYGPFIVVPNSAAHAAALRAAGLFAVDAPARQARRAPPH